MVSYHSTFISRSSISSKELSLKINRTNVELINTIDRHRLKEHEARKVLVVAKISIKKDSDYISIEIILIEENKKL